jgi:hypothetical protein
MVSDDAPIGETPMPFIVATIKVNTGCDGLRRGNAFSTMPLGVLR